jgi:hypothetical protein
MKHTSRMVVAMVFMATATLSGQKHRLGESVSLQQCGLVPLWHGAGLTMTPSRKRCFLARVGANGAMSALPCS